MHRRIAAWLAGLACLWLSPAALSTTPADLAAPAASGTITLHCGALIDGVAAAPRRDVAVRIEGLSKRYRHQAWQ